MYIKTITRYISPLSKDKKVIINAVEDMEKGEISYTVGDHVS
jgi:hypothetical protein